MKYAPVAILILLLAFLAYMLIVPKPEKLSSMEGKTMPALTLPLLGSTSGKAQLLPIQGHYTLVNIFASWCPGCAQEHPALMALAAHKTIQMIGIAWHDTPEALTSWLNTHGNPYRTIAMDATGEAIIALGVTGAPESFFISPEGIILHHQIGLLTQETIDHHILPHLKP